MCDGVHWIVGMGATGQSVARFFTQRNMPFSVCDTRADVPIDPVFEFAQTVVRGYIPDDLYEAKTITVSPGVPLETPEIDNAHKTGVPVLGDLEWFVQKVRGKVIAITGTNSKSTTTTLVDAILRQAGKNSIAGGNLGIPVLDLPDNKDYYVIECSSFGLERVRQLPCLVGAFIHFAPNHLDRHGSLQAYAKAKRRVYRDAQIAVYNKACPETTPPNGMQAWSFGEEGDICLEGWTVKIKGKTAFTLPTRWQNALYVQNMLASIAIAVALDIEWEAIEKALQAFTGLPHRMQWVRDLNTVTWINDSKGTNLAAIAHAWQNTTTQNKLILLVGGQLKGEDPRVLQALPSTPLRSLIAFGQDGPVFFEALSHTHPIQRCNTLDEAVQLARNIAQPHDTVVLVPGGTSYDAFANYSERGEKFTKLVEAL